jgi:oxalate decarboxylase/phosphoglucose isomerase-like protein (cupin superfamily)
MLPKLSALAFLALLPAAFAQTVDADLVAKLRAAPTQPDRIRLLRDDQFVFSFLNGVGVSSGAGGRTISANSGNFPALIGNGVAMTLGYLEPCGFNIPHTHPRATEINIAVNGSLRTGMLQENGARFVYNIVPAGSATVFPKGAIHFEMNLECQPTIFVAAFDHEDPGTLAIAQRFFGLPPDIIAASLDSIGVTEIADIEAKLPNNAAEGTVDCLKRCGITKVNQPTTQRQPRVAGNALPNGYTGPSAPPPPPPAPSGNRTSGSLGGNVETPDPRFNGQPTGNDQKTYLIALLAINGAFVVGTLGALIFYLVKKRGPKRERIRESMMPQFAPLRDEKETEYYDPYHRTPSPATAGK